MRGYHVYKDVWEAAVGEELSCERELGNHQDPFAVAVVRSTVTVGHVPKKISSVCSMFLRRGGAIKCQVTASKRYLEDLPQGGREIPCTVTFEGNAKDLAKVKRLVKYALTQNTAASKSAKDDSVAAKDESVAPKDTKDQPASKRIRIEDTEVKHVGPSSSVYDIDCIDNGEKLSDLHINSVVFTTALCSLSTVKYALTCISNFSPQR